MTGPIHKADARITETIIDDEVVVMNAVNGNFFSLTQTGKIVWNLVDGIRTRDSIIEHVAREYETDSGQVASDVDHFLKQLSDAGLVELG